MSRLADIGGWYLSYNDELESVTLIEQIVEKGSNSRRKLLAQRTGSRELLSRLYDRGDRTVAESVVSNKVTSEKLCMEALEAYGTEVSEAVYLRGTLSAGLQRKLVTVIAEGLEHKEDIPTALVVAYPYRAEVLKDFVDRLVLSGEETGKTLAMNLFKKQEAAVGLAGQYQGTLGYALLENPHMTEEVRRTLAKTLMKDLGDENFLMAARRYHAYIPRSEWGWVTERLQTIDSGEDALRRYRSVVKHYTEHDLLALDGDNMRQLQEAVELIAKDNTTIPRKAMLLTRMLPKIQTSWAWSQQLFYGFDQELVNQLVAYNPSWLNRIHPDLRQNALVYSLQRCVGPKAKRAKAYLRELAYLNKNYGLVPWSLVDQACSEDRQFTNWLVKTLDELTRVEMNLLQQIEEHWEGTVGELVDCCHHSCAQRS